jgi:hypothetical protein
VSVYSCKSIRLLKRSAYSWMDISSSASFLYPRPAGSVGFELMG